MTSFKTCPYCDGMMSGYFYEEGKEGLEKHIFCPSCGYEEVSE